MVFNGWGAAAIMAAAIAMVAPPPASAQVYVTGSVGYTSPADLDVESGGVDGEFKLDGGIAANVAVGYKFPFGLRLEVEGGYNQVDLDKLKVLGTSVKLNGDLDIYTATVNAFYDIDTGTMFTPYVGGGIGIAHQELSRISAPAVGVTTSSDDSTDFTWLLEGGVAIKVANSFSIVPSYRFQTIVNGGSSGGVDADDLQLHIFRLGARFSF
jgi:opacity protein-like surface antigen